VRRIATTPRRGTAPRPEKPRSRPPCSKPLRHAGTTPASEKKRPPDHASLALWSRTYADQDFEKLKFPDYHLGAVGRMAATGLVEDIPNGVDLEKLMDTCAEPERPTATASCATRLELAER
jgi:hypothetical protein